MQPAAPINRKRCFDEHIPHEPQADFGEPQPKRSCAEANSDMQYELFCQNVQDGIVRSPSMTTSQVSYHVSPEMRATVEKQFRLFAEMLLIEGNFWPELDVKVRNDNQLVAFKTYCANTNEVEKIALLTCILDCIMKELHRHSSGYLNQIACPEEHIRAVIGLLVKDRIDTLLAWLKNSAPQVLHCLVLEHLMVSVMEKIKLHKEFWLSQPQNVIRNVKNVACVQNREQCELYLFNLQCQGYPPEQINVFTWLLNLPAPHRAATISLMTAMIATQQTVEQMVLPDIEQMQIN